MFSKEKNVLPILNQDDDEEKKDEEEGAEETEAMMENQELGDEEGEDTE